MERLQQLIQTLEVRGAKRLFANALVKTDNDYVRSGIADLSGDDVSHSALQHEVIVPFVPLQFRRRQLFGEPHPCPLATGEEFGKGIFRRQAGDVVRGEFGAGTEEIRPVDAAGAGVADDIFRADGAQGFADRLQHIGPHPRVKPCVVDIRDDAPERIIRHVDTDV